MKVEVDKKKLMIGAGILGAIALLILGVYFMNKRKKKIQIEYSTGELDEQTEDREQTSVDEASPFPLSAGSKGKEVEQLQLYLLRKHGLESKYDGVFDQITQDNVKRALTTEQVSQEVFKEKRMSDYKTFKN
ncbi:hypothetical protein [uncultured Microscilla sp.]|uniref:hypothetical protein n=1 Tax=uncultured Microscilla sp. TaxID=432653 RepID=UPI002635746D|nr:hypothetical protein [uncultured Microscilla sp.]